VARIRPDAIVTFGPEGGYGHPDHRLVGAVTTQVVQAGGDGVPARLLYVGFPKDRIPEPSPLPLPWSPTDPRFLTVRVPYSDADLAATRAALACHKSQFTPEGMENGIRFLHEVLGGHAYLRPWFGTASGEDVFAARP
jgi:LmbE family N-acetylglucosaminyl deacetylase